MSQQIDSNETGLKAEAFGEIELTKVFFLSTKIMSKFPKILYCQIICKPALLLPKPINHCKSKVLKYLKKKITKNYAK